MVLNDEESIDLVVRELDSLDGAGIASYRGFDFVEISPGLVEEKTGIARYDRLFYRKSARDEYIAVDIDRETATYFIRDEGLVREQNINSLRLKQA